MTISTAATTTTTLRRHNSITTVLQDPQVDQNTSQTLSSSASLLNLKLVSLINSPLSSYTSLRDVLPSSSSSTAAAINSPTATSSGYEISIRNHLVKQAAWAYLQPMSASPTTSSAPYFLRRLCHRFTAFLTFINHHLLSALARVFHGILHALGYPLSS